ncbi:MAG TPA: DPP IV N-terminal domain-containing protein, partial [Opitutaceae bacterium]|nr:DPP IV N-terminal domain-containing protein [Opitutaceae bacterium]
MNMSTLFRRWRWAAGLLVAGAVVFGLMGAADAPSAPAAAGPALGPLERPLWLRYPAISPDGTQIAFSFEGNLFVVPAAGGTARALTANGHHNFMPVWSPDGKFIA